MHKRRDQSRPSLNRNKSTATGTAMAATVDFQPIALCGGRGRVPPLRVAIVTLLETDPARAAAPQQDLESQELDKPEVKVALSAQ